MAERLKGLFVKAHDGVGLEEVCRMARAEAEHLGLGNRRDIIVKDAVYMPRLRGYSVVVIARSMVVREEGRKHAR